MNIYVFDSGPLIDLFRHYYPERFPTLWAKFDKLVEDNRLFSVREVSNEVGARDGSLSDWTKQHKELFEIPVLDELIIVSDIFKIPHFQQVIRKQERLEGKPVADPFVVAKAKTLNAVVVTTEKYSENAAKLPNICLKLGVKFLNLEEFMKIEKWSF